MKEKESENNNLKSKSIVQIIIIVCLGTFMSALDSSIVNISLPAISDYFKISLTTVEWVILSYLIVISSLLLTYGRIGDLYGHKKIYLVGFAVFTIGSLFCGLSTSVIFLIFSRAIQALGAGMLMSMGPALITIATPAKNRGKYLGFLAVAVSVALSVGPVAGGLLTSYFGWQSIFFINIPIGLGAFVWSVISIPKISSDIRQPFDYAGSLLLFLALVSIIFPLTFADKIGWSSPLIIGFICAGIILFTIFFIVESKIKNPMLDLNLFKNRLFSMSNLALLLNYMSQFTVALIVPFYLVQLRDFSSSKAGLLMIANPVMVMITAPIAGHISDRMDSRFISSAGMIFTSAGLFLLGTMKTDTNIFLLILYTSIIGLGIGIFQTPNNSAIMGSVPLERRGTASSMIATMRNLGMVLGVTLSGTIFSSRQISLEKTLSRSGIEGIQLENIAFTGAMQTTFIAGSVLAVVAVFISLVRGPLNKNRTNNQF